ncbi:MAG: response regulator transcription factor [Lachnospiraceae bacterium]|nr:response regulator transcription factor [Lachnospiraceae bacterium]
MDMLTIAVCDGGKKDLSRTAEQIRASISPSDDLTLQIDLFQKPFDLLDVMEKGNFYDIYILETVLTGYSGVELARYLRKCGITKPIIFITSDKSYALEAFEVDALQYLVKPVTKERMTETLNKARAMLKNERRAQTVFKTVDGFRHVYFRNILFTETDGKYQLVHIQGGDTYRVRTTATAMAQSLCAHPGFVRCGSSYTLNLYHIDHYDSMEVLIKDGSILPVPRGAYAGLNTAYTGYFTSVAT